VHVVDLDAWLSRLVLIALVVFVIWQRRPSAPQE
jgi:hypothetical protein